MGVITCSSLYMMYMYMYRHIHDACQHYHQYNWYTMYTDLEPRFGCTLIYGIFISVFAFADDQESEEESYVLSLFERECCKHFINKQKVTEKEQLHKQVAFIQSRSVNDIRLHLFSPCHWGGGGNQAYSRLSTTYGHITDCKLVSVV